MFNCRVTSTLRVKRSVTREAILGDVGVSVSFQISILKVLASYPDGRASLEALKSDLNILMTSGRDWADRMKRLAARAPNIDVFSQQLILRDPLGWQITPEGRVFLTALEAPIAAEPVADTTAQPIKAVAVTAVPVQANRPQKIVSRPPTLFSVAATSPFPAKNLPLPTLDYTQQDRLHPPVRLIGRKDRRKGKRSRDAVVNLRNI